MLTPELIQRVQSLCIRSRRRVTDVFSGEYRSAIRGSGLEFEEFREYAPGDDIRRIDWNVSARMDRPFIKIHREERERTVYLLVDVSRSLRFGRVRDKSFAAGEIAAILAYVAGINKDRVGLVLFSDRVECFIRPGKGIAHVWNLVSHLVDPQPVGVGTDLVVALDFHGRVARRHSVCFVISDFLGCKTEALRFLRSRHEYVLARVFDPLEEGFSLKAMVEIEDLETGSTRTALPLTKQAAVMQSHQILQKEAARRGISMWNLNCEKDYVGELIHRFRGQGI